MGAVAASGGYYVSMSADAIVANPGTITGSIGVVTGKLVARELKDRRRRRVRFGAHQPQRRCVVDQRSRSPTSSTCHVEAEADLFYTDFIKRVADGRKMTVEAVDAIARGRVWTGADALERGLVDELGGLRTAIARAKVLAGLDARCRCPPRGLPGFVADRICCGRGRRRSPPRRRCPKRSAR